MEFAVGLRALCHSFELLCLSWSLNTKNIKDAQREHGVMRPIYTIITLS